MLFNSFQFAIFFLVTLAAFHALPSKQRPHVLLVASAAFYTLWIPVYSLLFAADLVVNYVLLRLMIRSARPRLYLSAAVVFTLGLLGYYKYAAFLIESAMPMLTGLGLEASVPDVFLPLGISFYSFQILALTIDSYRGQIKPVRSFTDYAVFISFFPQLIAGPIVRGREFLPQLERGAQSDATKTRRGLWLIAAGLVKKVVFADFMLAPFVDQVYAHPGLASAPLQLLAMYSFAFQIYFDFSGYTDMARGMALLLGFELPLNFTEPYLSRNPSEFWRRWHMTLSRWLRDYLYISLGGNRRGQVRTSVNLALTMLLGGLWHGAAWNFVVWGGIHGAWLMVHRWSSTDDGRPTDRPLAWSDWWRVALCFHAVCLAWVFFRAPTFTGATAVIAKLFGGSYVEPWPLVQVGVLAAAASLHVVERYARENAGALRDALGRSYWAVGVEGLAFGVVVGLAIALSGLGGEFIYFQF